MRKLLLILIFLCSKTVSADTGSSYVLKIEICTIEDEIITGFVKTNDYFVDKHMNNEFGQKKIAIIIRQYSG